METALTFVMVAALNGWTLNRAGDNHEIMLCAATRSACLQIAKFYLSTPKGVLKLLAVGVVVQLSRKHDDEQIMTMSKNDE